MPLGPSMSKHTWDQATNSNMQSEWYMNSVLTLC